MAKDLTKLYSRPGAEAFHVFEDDNGQVQVKMGNRTAVTAVPSGSGVAIPAVFPSAGTLGVRAQNLGAQICGLMGDSRIYSSHITDGGTAGTTYPAQEIATTRDDLNMNGLAHHLQLVSGGAIICPRSCNYGISGQRTWEMLARVDTAVAGMQAAGATLVVLLMSTNDRGAAGITHVDSIANITAIKDKFLAAGIAVVIVAEEPRGDTTFTAQRLSATLLKEHMMVRRAIMGMHNGRTVFSVDAWSKFADLASANGDALLGYTADGLHANGILNHKLARSIWDGHLSKILPAYSWAPAGVADEYSAINTAGAINLNPCMTGTGGVLGASMTGQMATSWTGAAVPANATIAASKVTGANGEAVQQFVIGSTGSITSTAIDLCRRDTNVGTNDLAVGRKVRAVACLDIEAGATGLYEIDVYVAANTLTTRCGSQAPTFTETRLQTDAVSDGVYITEAITIPAGATAVRLGVRAYFAGGTASATVRVKWCKLVYADL